MLLALTSLYTGRPVHTDVGMTGEITLRGRVLPIGGVKMKVLAAHRAGLKKVIMPKRNEQDLDDLPDEVRNAMTIILADQADEVLAAALDNQRASSAPAVRLPSECSSEAKGGHGRREPLACRG